MPCSIVFPQGCKVCHPLLGAGVVEKLLQDEEDAEESSYLIRYIWDNSFTSTPVRRAVQVRLRPVIQPRQCAEVIHSMTLPQNLIRDNWKVQQHAIEMSIRQGDPWTNAKIWNRIFSKKKHQRTSKEIQFFNLVHRVLISELALARNLEITYVEREVYDTYAKNQGAQYFNRF